ncbi:MAG: indole-3-glycerol phosphate synthase TrpC [Pseudomonadota bacterium]|nr:indole-3-glycerol phosphate synthase TrpC [Pseudomonadota bacterium]
MKNSILDKILEYKKKEVQQAKINFPKEDLIDLLEGNSKPVSFIKELIKKNNNNLPGIIAEVKKASPSKGIIKEDFNHIEIAKNYIDGGAACISVLTDFPSFQGHLQYMKDIKDKANIPLLRKDFMIDPYQIYESRLHGADCILIIMKMINIDIAGELYELSTKLGMDVIFEVNNPEELSKALELSPKIIGINNRNLNDFSTNINNSIQLSKSIPEEICIISESGITNRKDIEILMENKIKNFLIGENLIKSQNIKEKLKKLING